MLVNGNQLKIYKKPLSGQEFIETLEKSVLVVEQGSALFQPHLDHKKKKGIKKIPG